MITITNLELLIAFVQEFSEAALFYCLEWVELGGLIAHFNILGQIREYQY